MNFDTNLAWCFGTFSHDVPKKKNKNLSEAFFNENKNQTAKQKAMRMKTLTHFSSRNSRFFFGSLRLWAFVKHFQRQGKLSS
jgi:hypothetical protein